MITEVNPHTDPIMHAWGSLEILLGIHRSNTLKVLPSPTKRKSWLHLKDFHVFGLGNVRTRAFEESTNSVLKAIY